MKLKLRFEAKNASFLQLSATTRTMGESASIAQLVRSIQKFSGRVPTELVQYVKAFLASITPGYRISRMETKCLMSARQHRSRQAFARHVVSQGTAGGADTTSVSRAHAPSVSRGHLPSTMRFTPTVDNLETDARRTASHQSRSTRDQFVRHH